MQISKAPKIWKYIFYIGYYLTILHYIRFLYAYLSGYIAWHKYYIDYSFQSTNSLFIRLISALIIFILYKQKSRFPITSTTIIWFILWILLSHEHDRYTFLIMPIIFIFSLINSLFYRYKNN